MAWPGWENFNPALHGATQAVAKKRGKYGAVKTEIDGHTFASKHEATRYLELKALVAAGEITGLELQPQFPLSVQTPDGTTVTIGRYLGDFAYQKDGQRVIEDAKGMRLPLYIWKKRHAELQYGIAVVEV
jgi:hypothetical protein